MVERSDLDHASVIDENVDRSASLDCGGHEPRGFVAPADVAGGNGEYLLIRLDMAQTDFDGKLPAVLLPPKQIEAGSHWTSLALFEKMLTIFDVMLAQAFRDQGFDSALQQLFL